MKEAFLDGYRFFRADCNGKVFIEITPAQNAWAPISAENWLFIDCFWVSGQYKGKGFANKLFDQALEIAKDNHYNGIAALASDKKRPFLSDPSFYKYKGFQVADTAPPYYELLALPLIDNVSLPKFTATVQNCILHKEGIVIYYSNHCPHLTKYVPLLKAIAEKMDVPFQAHKFTSKQEAQASPNPFSTYSMFFQGNFITNEIFSEGKLMNFIQENKD